MVRMITHAEAEELLGAYALDAVEATEAEEIEAHLEVCPRCRAELRNHREVVGVLAYAGHDAPEGLWDRVLAGINDKSDVASSEPATPLRLMSFSSDGSAAIAALPRLRRRARFISMAAAAAVLVVALLGIQVSRLQSRTDHIDSQLKAFGAQPSMATVTAALDSPGARSLVLRPLTGGTTTLDAVILPSGQGYLYDSKLTPLPSAETYQLWGLTGNEKVSYGLIGSDPAMVESFQTASHVDALAVTAEVAGGVVASTHSPVVFASID